MPLKVFTIHTNPEYQFDQFLTDLNSNFEYLTGSSGSFSGGTINGDTNFLGLIQSGGTDLYNIFQTIEYTHPYLPLSGGTVTGDTNFTTALTASTGNFGIILSGGTDLYNIFALSGSVVGASNFIQSGLNTYTGGTSNSPTINVSGLTISNLSASGSVSFSSGVSFNMPSDQYVIIDGRLNPRQATAGIFQILQRPNLEGTRAINISTNSDGFGDTNSIAVDYTASGLTSSDVGSGVKVQIDKSDSTGGRITAFRVSTLVNSGSTDVVGLFVTPQVSPILHQVGEDIDGMSAFIYSANTSAYTNVTSSFTSSTSNAPIFENVNDYVYIGSDNKFYQIGFILELVANKGGVRPLFEYSKGSSVWGEFVPIDGTRGLRNNGTITWGLDIISDWSQNIVESLNKYWIRIKRQNSSSITSPVEREVTISIQTGLYRWDKDGNVNVNSIHSNISSATTIYSGSTNLYNIFSTSDYYTTGATLNGITATFNRNDGGSYNLSLPNHYLPLSGGTVTGNTQVVATLTASTGNFGMIQSGGTNLYDIFAVAGTVGGASTFVQPGINTYTGGTASAPSVNISAATLTYLSATTISGGTIYSGSTEISTIFVQPNHTQTLTNKRITKRVVSIASSATPTINTNSGDIFSMTGLSTNMTNASTNLTGSPIHGDLISIEITDNGVARTLSWGSSFAASGTLSLPTTTVISTMLRVLFQYNSASSLWVITAVV